MLFERGLCRDARGRRCLDGNVNCLGVGVVRYWWFWGVIADFKLKLNGDEDGDS